MNNTLIKAYLLFLVFSLLNFAVTVFFIAKTLLAVALCNTLLNLIPIYLISRYLVGKLKSLKMTVLFWISCVILSFLLVIPFGAFVLDFFLDIFYLLFD